MVFAYHVTGLDFNAFRPLIEALEDNGDLPAGSTAIAFPTDDPGVKNIYVASTLQILNDAEEITSLTPESFAGVCRLVQAGSYQTWGNEKLFTSTENHHGAAN